MGDRDAELEGLSTELLARYEELNLLYRLSADLAGIFDVDALTRIALDRALEVLDASHGGVVLREADGMRLRAASDGAPFQPGTLLPSGGTIAEEVIRTGKQIVRDPGEPDPVNTSVRSIGQPSLAVPLLPIRGGTEPLGSISLLRPEGAHRFTASDVQLVEAVATQLAARLEAARLVAELQEAERAQREVELAATVQRSLLPDLPPELGGLRVEARSIPAARVGGDLYDAMVDASGAVWMLVADVAGHGIDSALTMASVRAVLRRELRDSASPAAALGASNDVLFDDLVRAEQLVTAYCARWEPGTGALAVASAAHNPALVRRADGTVDELDVDGTPLGLIRGAAFEEAHDTLAQGDTLLLFTDGVVEARDESGEMLGDDRLRALVARAQSPGELVESITAAVDAQLDGHARRDDVTLLAAAPR